MGVYKYKQSIVIRNDPNMPKGKLVAQVARASTDAILIFAEMVGGEGTENKI